MTDDVAAALRLELQANREAGTLEGLGDVPDRYETAARLVDTLQSGMQAARDSQRYTTAGLADRSQTLGAPLLAMAEHLEREATQIAEGLTAEGDAAWNALLRPPATAEARELARELRFLMRDEDQAILKMQLLWAARTGNDLVLRAVLSFPSPPLDLDGAKGWRPLITDDVRDEIQRAVAEHASPQGPQAWRAEFLRGIAAHLRRAVTNG